VVLLAAQTSAADDTVRVLCAHSPLLPYAAALSRIPEPWWALLTAPSCRATPAQLAPAIQLRHGFWWVGMGST